MSAEARTFVYRGFAHRVIFGPGASRDLGEEIGRLGCRAPFLATTNGQAKRLSQPLADYPFVGRYTDARMHTPVVITEQALADLKRVDADAVVSIGGGSATGLGKALALRTGLPLIAIGTSYGGSEMTELLGETDAGRKRTLRDPAVLPAATIYDVDLTLGLPAETSLASGLNALAHAVEAVYSREASPITTAVALAAITKLAGALETIIACPADPDARNAALAGACSAGFVLNAVPMGLHHKLCHTLGGLFDLDHARMHALLLPYAIAYNRPAIGDALAAISGAIGGREPVEVIRTLGLRLPGLKGLRDLGMPKEGVDAAVDAVVSQPYPNPQPLEHSALHDMLRRAWAGDSP